MVESDTLCGFSAFVNFAQVVAAFGPSSIYKKVKQSAIDKYTGSLCQFAIISSSQMRSNVSRILNAGGICENYLIRQLIVERSYLFIYLCGNEEWVSVTGEVFTTSLNRIYDNFENVAYPGGSMDFIEPDPVPLPPGYTVTNGNFPALPSPPQEYPCDGPYTACGNAFP